jgi:uncharacterized protein YndB with AHSA1/START domain
MSPKAKTPKDYTGHEVVIVREFAAPRQTVFEAWTDPKQLMQWWGPKGFTNPVCEWPATPGGAIHVVMRAPNGEDYPMGGAFREVLPPERLVFTSGPLNEKKEMLFELLHTITFVERKGKTTVTVHARVLWTTPQASQYLGGYEAGMTQSLERLADLVSPKTASTADREIISTRVFDAPRELIWEAWTNPDHLIHWWGPKGFRNTFHEFNCHPGGVWRYVMHSPDGRDFKNEMVFVELTRPQRIILDHTVPPHFRLTATFEAQGKKTKLTFHQVFATVAEYEAVKKLAIPGNEQNFDRLAAHLLTMA